MASAASASAAFVVPMIWQPGTIPAAAMAPVIVMLVSELLNRPAEHVSRAGRQLRERRARRREHPQDEDEAVTEPYRRYGGDRRRRALRVAAATGLVVFAGVAAVWTVAELAVGESVSGDGRTTFFGGGPAQQEPSQPVAPLEEPGDAPVDPAPEETTPPAREPGVPDQPAPAPPDQSAPPAPPDTPVPAPAPAPAPSSPG